MKKCKCWYCAGSGELLYPRRKCEKCNGVGYTIAEVKKLYIPKTAGELYFGNTNPQEPNPVWHLMDIGGGGEHTVCSMAFEEIEDLSSAFGIKTKSKRGGFCDCPECIQSIVELKKMLRKIKEVIG